MGANKQSRFHGKDPRYKNRERTTLADIDSAVSRWDGEADTFISDRRADDLKASRPTMRHRVYKIAPEPELEDIVKKYLAERGIQPLDAIIIPSPPLPERVRHDAPEHVLDVRQAAPTSRDLLLQMFIEKKIDLGYFHAGRRWQWDREAAVIQPAVSIDWSRSSSSPYQDSDISERQWLALRRRRVFCEYAGKARASLLDFLLEVDHGRADFVRLTKKPPTAIERTLKELLEKACECFA